MWWIVWVLVLVNVCPTANYCLAAPGNSLKIIKCSDKVSWWGRLFWQFDSKSLWFCAFWIGQAFSRKVCICWNANNAIIIFHCVLHHFLFGCDWLHRHQGSSVWYFVLHKKCFVACMKKLTYKRFAKICIRKNQIIEACCIHKNVASIRYLMEWRQSLHLQVLKFSL